jgi:predicted CoA-binding protein
MTKLERIGDFLAQPRLAIVGVSRQPKDFSRLLLREFRDRGYQALPVNPEADDLDGQACFRSLQQIQPPIDTVLLMTKPAVTDAVVRDCAAAGVKRVWFYRAGGQGAVTPYAVQFCEAHGMDVIPGECPLMFLPRSAWFHRFHGLLKKIARTYPS